MIETKLGTVKVTVVVFDGCHVYETRHQLLVSECSAWLAEFKANIKKANKEFGKEFGTTFGHLVEVNGELQRDVPVEVLECYENFRYIKGRKIVEVRASTNEETSEWGFNSPAFVFILETGCGLIVDPSGGWSIRKLNVEKDGDEPTVVGDAKGMSTDEFLERFKD